MNPAQIRGTVDHTVLRQYGITIPAVPRLDGLNLLYLAGAAYLLKR